MSEDDAIVQCYSGSSYADEPRGFVLRGEHRLVQAVRRRWREPAGPCFEVLADDARLYVLAYDQVADRWRISVKATTTSAEVDRR